MNETRTQKDLKDLKNKLIDTILIAGTSIGLVAFILSLHPFDSIIFNLDILISVFVLASFVCAYTFRNRIPTKYKAGVITLMLYTLFISEIFVYGTYSNDVLFLVLIPFLSVLFFPFRVTLLLYSSSIITYLLIGYLFSSGTLAEPYYDHSDTSFIVWVENAFILTAIIFVITLFLYEFDRKIFSLVKDLQIKNDNLAEREYLLSTIKDNFPRSYMSVIDSNFIIRMTGGSEFKARGIDSKELEGKSVMDVLLEFGEESLNTILNAYKKTLAGEGQIFQIQLGDQYQLYKTMPLPDKNEEIKSFLSVVENITESVETKNLIQDNLDEKNVLLQEIHHRVKNNLAVVSGLLSLQSYNIKDPKSKYILEKSTNRIMSIAKVHEMLYESKNFNRIPFSRYINELASIILDSINYDGKSIDFTSNISVDYISINHGVPLGIIFNELITNSVKYGFESSLGNKISIKVDQRDDRFYVIYEDNGCGIEDFDTAVQKSLGFTLIESLIHQIDAEFEYDTNDRFKLAFNFATKLTTSPYQ